MRDTRPPNPTRMKYNAAIKQGPLRPPSGATARWLSRSSPWLARPPQPGPATRGKGHILGADLFVWVNTRARITWPLSTESKFSLACLLICQQGVVEKGEVGIGLRVTDMVMNMVLNDDDDDSGLRPTHAPPKFL